VPQVVQPQLLGQQVGATIVLELGDGLVGGGDGRLEAAGDELGLPQRAWTAEDGSARSVVEVVADELGPSLRWATATTTSITRSQSQ
jgi:hypothetical protein